MAESSRGHEDCDSTEEAQPSAGEKRGATYPTMMPQLTASKIWIPALVLERLVPALQIPAHPPGRHDPTGCGRRNQGIMGTM